MREEEERGDGFTEGTEDTEDTEQIRSDPRISVTSVSSVNPVLSPSHSSFPSPPSSSYNPDDYDHYDDEPTAEENLAKALAHAATLDPATAACVACSQATDAWVVRHGMLGDGLCRTCVSSRADENAFATSTLATLREGVTRLLHLREERDKKIATELAKVPF